MNFTSYLKRNKNFLIIWFLFHGFALFVNFFGIKGDVGNTKKYISNRTAYEIINDINLFTNSSYLNKNSTSSFYPFVQFYEHFKTPIDYSTSGYEGSNADYYEKEFTTFNGIFYKYDISEFIFYFILILVFFYFRFESIKSKLKTTSTISKQ